MKLTHLMAAAGAAAILAFAAPAFAEESSYTPGTVWNVSSIEVMPGQFENYMDWLAKNWRKQQDFAVKEGIAVSYHVFAVNNARKGEPDLYLAIEYKDYASTADRLAHQKKWLAMVNSDARQMNAASGERKVMRVQAGSMQMQELKFK